MNTCEQKHKKLANNGETKRPDGTCGGEMDEVKSADGATSYGFVCRVCGHARKICEGCGKNWDNLDAHMVDRSTGAHRECYFKAPQYRRMVAVRDIGKSAK